MVQPSKDNTARGGESQAIHSIPIEIDYQIWVIFQDSKGNYWFGSNGMGLYFYDGMELNLFTTTDGLVDNSIRGMQEDKKGNLFIETPRGISKYDGNSFIDLEPVESDSNEWKLERDDLWFGYNTNDVYRYDGESLYELKLPRQDLNKSFGWEVEGVPFESNNNSPYAVFGVNKDREGNIWFGTATAGAFRYDGSSVLWIGERELSMLPDGRVPGVRCMLQDKDENFWLSNFKSKYKIDSTSPKGYIKYEGAKIPNEEEDHVYFFNSGIEAKNGDLWMTTYGGEVWHYDGQNLTLTELRKGDEDLLLITIYEDKDGTLWLGTNNDGVYRHNGNAFEKFEPKS